MSEQDRMKILEGFDKNVPDIPPEQKHFLLGFMEGVSQMNEKKKRRRKPKK